MKRLPCSLGTWARVCRLLFPLVAVTRCSSAEQTAADPNAMGCKDDRCGGTEDCFARCLCEGDTREVCGEECSVDSYDRKFRELTEPWPPEWIPFEGLLLSTMNERRARGGCCGDLGCFEPSQALVRDERLTRAARWLAEDFIVHRYFGHYTRDRWSAFDRIRAMGFHGCSMGENLSSTHASAEDVVASWLLSSEHCANLYEPRFSRVGIGYSESPEHTLSPLWVADFGG
jgi:hypothetical protein